MASAHMTETPAGRHDMRLIGEPRLFILDAGAVAEGERLHEGVVGKLVLLVESEGAQVVIREVSDLLRRQLEHSGVEWSLHPQVLPAGQSIPPSEVMAQAGIPASECLIVLADGGATPPPGSHAFYVGQGAPLVPQASPPAGAWQGAVPLRLTGPAGTDALLALYGTALIQEKSGVEFRATSQGGPPPTSAPFDSGLFQGLVKSLGRVPERETLPAAARPAPELDGQMIRTLASTCFVRVLRNIQPNGAIVASPAKGEQPGQPNYWFVWQRDAGHTLLNLIDWSRRAPFGLDTAQMNEAINSYLGFLTLCQQYGNLGVSRYTVDGQPIPGYGNPQLDGPALSALAMMKLLDPRPVYPQIRALLNYLLTPEGQGPCYDSWEFVYGRICNALLLKRKAFRAGARLANVLTEEEDSRRYREEAGRLEAELVQYIDQARGYLVSSREPANPWFEQISGLDVATLGAILTAWDSNDDFLNLTHPAVLGTVMALDDAFGPYYAVNRAWQAAGHMGMGWGRFPEDANDGVGSTGGNPWPLVTLWGAQFCYLLAEKLATAGPFVVTDERQARYLNQVVGDEVARVGNQLGSERILMEVLPALRKRGDGYLRFVLAHQPTDGTLSEQINRDTGQPQGARDLTWAMGELLSTLALRG